LYFADNIVLLFWRKLAQRALQRPFSLRAMTVTALITYAWPLSAAWLASWFCLDSTAALCSALPL
jgi:hypothetical protein